jgi:hypothetical protein
MNRLPTNGQKTLRGYAFRRAFSTDLLQKRSRRDRTAAESHLLSNPIRDLSISSGEKSGSYQHLENDGLIPR